LLPSVAICVDSREFAANRFGCGLTATMGSGSFFLDRNSLSTSPLDGHLAFRGVEGKDCHSVSNVADNILVFIKALWLE
jgi:hypothetical protein